MRLLLLLLRCGLLLLVAEVGLGRSWATALVLNVRLHCRIPLVVRV